MGMKNRHQTANIKQQRSSKKGLVLFVVCCLLFVVFPKNVHAITIETSYADTYTVTSSSDVLAQRKITLTNTTATVYVSEYEFSFSNPDIITDLAITEDSVPANFTKTSDNGKLRVSVKLKNPAIGNGAQKTLLITYTLLHFLSERGVYRELYLPISAHSSNEISTSYSVEVDTPADFPDVSIAKPATTTAQNHRYIWSDVRTLEHKNMFIAFSKHAYYDVELKYALPNNAPYAQKVAIPFVPEGMYQKIYVTDINPPPPETQVDPDDNYLGVYVVPGQDVLHVTFKGIVELTTDPREDVRDYFRNQFNRVGLSRYLTEEKYWSLSTEEMSKYASTQLTQPKDIYTFVSSTLSYDTSRISDKLTRMGASWALQNPTHAVCMEYSDLFIALAREKGIPAREVVGYAVTDNYSLQPLSFFGDVLHAWPEYYDKARETWQHIDPTWGNTALVDYFSTFDLDHIAFVYHGKDTTFPLPPGVYKIRKNTKDVYVTPTDQKPVDERRIEIVMPSSIEFVAGSSNKLHVLLTSKSNVFLYNIQIEIQDKQSHQLLGKRIIERLEPYGAHEYEITITRPFTSVSADGKLEFLADKTVIGERLYTVKSPVMYLIGQYKGVIIGVAVGLVVVIGSLLLFKR